MKYLLALFLIFSFTFAEAQELFDIIHLKNGGFYTGNITEYIPSEYAIIQLLDKRIIKVEVDDIDSFVVGNREILKKSFKIKSKGYFNNTLGGMQFSQDDLYVTQVSVSLHTINGYKLNGHHFGLGLGIENYASRWYTPVYADYSYQFLDQKFTPLAGISGGFMVPLQSSDFGRYSRYNYQRGGFISGRLGIAAYSSNRAAFLLSITYKYIYFSGAKYDDFNPTGQVFTYNGSANLHRIGLMVGFVIN